MNILYVCSEYPPFRSGGIGSVTKIVAEAMVSKGHNVYVAGYYSSMKEHEIHEVENGVHIYRFCRVHVTAFVNYLRLFLNKLHLVRPFIQRDLSYFESKIQNLIDSYGIDVLEIPDYYEFNIYNARLSFKTFSIPTVVRTHGAISFVESYSGRINKAAELNDHNHIARAQYLSFVSSFSRRYLSELVCLSTFAKEAVIFNPVEDSFQYYNVASSNNVILFIGKMIETKGAISIIKAFNFFHKTHRSWKLRMLGGGNIELIQEEVDPDVMSSVTFLGYCGRDVVKKEIDNCSFACIPSYFETFGMVPLEVMARTRPVIFSNTTSGPELIDDSINGYLVDPKNISAIVDRMNKLADSDLVRDSFGKAAFKKVKDTFSSSIVISKMESFYLDIIG